MTANRLIRAAVDDPLGRQAVERRARQYVRCTGCGSKEPDLAGAAASAGALSISSFLGNGAAQAAVAFNFAQSLGVIFTGSVAEFIVGLAQQGN